MATARKTIRALAKLVENDGITVEIAGGRKNGARVTYMGRIVRLPIPHHEDQRAQHNWACHVRKVLHAS